jgi:hypothetical protein
MMLFAFTTLLGNLFYVEKSIYHINGKTTSKAFNTVYYIIASLVIFVGAGLSADSIRMISMSPIAGTSDLRGTRWNMRYTLTRSGSGTTVYG